MSGPRVLFVNHASVMSGAEFVLLDVVKAWRGASVFLFEDGPLNAAVRREGLDVLVSRRGSRLSGLRRKNSPLRAVPLAHRLLATAFEIARASRRYDVVYANSQKAFVLAAVAGQFVRRPLVWHLHDIVDGSHFGAAQRRLQIGLANARASRVVVPSRSAATAFTEAGGRASRVDVVPNGLDLCPDPRSANELRDVLGLPAGPLIGVFSRLAPWKGQHVVLEALARIPDVRCVVAGAALFGEEAYEARLRSLAAELGLGERVRFLGQRHDVSRLMQAVDAVVHPSVDPEPFGRTLVEAMLVGVPVIATDAGAASEILDGGAAGDLVPADDAGALASAIARVVAHPEAAAARVERARTRAQSRYSASRMRSAISDVIGRAARGAVA